jgi:hypothetical protein
LLSGASITIKGTLENKGVISSSGTFINKGMLTNTGTVINTGTFTNDGIFFNEGTFDTTKGKVLNNGVINNTKGRIDGTNNITGQGEIINAHSNSGCDTGLGFAGFVALMGIEIRRSLRRRV